MLDELESFFDDLWPPAGVFVVELGDGGGPSFSKILKRGPFGEESTGERAEEVATDKMQCLWEGVLEGLSEFVRQAGANADELASLLGEQGDLVGNRVDGRPRLKSCVTFVDEECECVGITAVVLGAGGAEAFAVLLDDGGIDEEEVEEVELAEEVDEVLAGLLDAEGNGLAGWQGFFKALNPGKEGFGGGADFRVSEAFAFGIEDAEVE